MYCVPNLKQLKLAGAGPRALSNRLSPKILCCANVSVSVHGMICVLSRRQGDTAALHVDHRQRLGLSCYPVLSACASQEAFCWQTGGAAAMHCCGYGLKLVGKRLALSDPERFISSRRTSWGPRSTLASSASFSYSARRPAAASALNVWACIVVHVGVAEVVVQACEGLQVCRRELAFCNLMAGQAVHSRSLLHVHDPGRVALDSAVTFLVNFVVAGDKALHLLATGQNDVV